jgi:CO dehydrogenase nickel-insertion accessory protein CooC1
MDPTRERPLQGQRIGLLGRGGAGKSTVAVLVARALRATGYEVVVLDADSTNVGLGSALGASRRPRPLIDYFGGATFGGGPVTCPVDDPTPLAGARLSLDEMPEDLSVRTPEGIRYMEAGKLAGQGTGAGCDGPIAKIARDLRIRRHGGDPVTVIDFKAGFEDTARGVITALNWILVVVDPSRAAVRMAIDAQRTVEQIRAGALPATSHLADSMLIETAHELYRTAPIRALRCVLNKFPNPRTRRRLEQLLESAGVEAVGAMPFVPSIEAAWLSDGPLPHGHSGRVALRIVRRLEADELHAARVLSRYRDESEKGESRDVDTDAHDTSPHPARLRWAGRFTLHS